MPENPKRTEYYSSGKQIRAQAWRVLNSPDASFNDIQWVILTEFLASSTKASTNPIDPNYQEETKLLFQARYLEPNITKIKGPTIDQITPAIIFFRKKLIS